MAFPGETTIFDDANRANGPAEAGAGATIWDSVDLGGAASSLNVTSNALAWDGSGDGNGTLTFASEADLLRVFDMTTTGSYFAYFFRLVSPTTGGWEGYWLLIEGGSWKIRKRVGGVISDVASVSHNSISQDDKVGLRVYGDLIEVYHYAANVWTQVISVTDSSFTAAGKGAMALGHTVMRVSNIFSGDPALLSPTSPVTIYVNPDHPAASNAYSRITASDPDTPMADMQAACMLAYATPVWADTIEVSLATAVDPLNVDPRMYKALDHVRYRLVEYPVGLPFGDNTGNMPITVTGVMAGNQRPIVSQINGRHWKNWIFENFQVGYDSGSGLDWGWLSSAQSCEDLIFNNCHFTGGALLVEAWAGELSFYDCIINAPLGPGTGPLEGRGFGFSSEGGFVGAPISAGDVNIINCILNNIRGNDGINVGMGQPDDIRVQGVLTIEDCLFHNVTENGPGGNEAFHCDAIQLLGVPVANIRRNTFIGCTNTLMASDFHNGVVTYENNLALGAGGLIQMQGTDEFIMRHNTLAQIPGPNLDATVIFFNRYSLPVPMKVTIVNNIIGGIRESDPIVYHEDSVIDHNIMLVSPGADTGFGQNLPGLPEFGTSARVDNLPIDTFEYGNLHHNFELANSPTISPGIGQGIVTNLTNDHFGRAYANPPDVGCLQSSATVVTSVARKPYIIGRSPSVDAINVSATTLVTLGLYPRPGNTMNAATINTNSFTLRDPGGAIIPSTVSLTAGGGGVFTITLDAQGQLYPYVVYMVTAASTIADSDGSDIGSQYQWRFRIVGLGGPATYLPPEPPVEAASPASSVTNIIHYTGDPHVPQDTRRRRMQVMQNMLRMGTPVIIKHMYNIEDVERGIAKKSPTWDDIYGQERHDDPFSHGIGFVSVENSTNEWIHPTTGAIVVANTSPGAGYVIAPKHRGYGPGFLTFAIMPDVSEDMFKLDESGALIRVQNARAKMAWYPEVNDNDLLILAEIDGKEQVIATHERYKLKQTTQISIRGLNRRGRRYPGEPMDYGNQLTVNQIFELALVPPNDTAYEVEIDR